MKNFPDNCFSKVVTIPSVSCSVSQRYLNHGCTIAEMRELSQAALMALLLATGGLGLLAQSALAQTPIRNSTTGSVQVDNNAFDIQTGPMENRSDIPLPADLIDETRERHAQPVILDGRAPNLVEMTLDTHYIDGAFNQLVDPDTDNTRYTLQPDSLQMTTRFNLGHHSGAHIYGEGIQVTVIGPDGTVRSRESVFVSGDKVTVGPSGQPLATTAELNVTYGADETVELRVLNIRRNGEAPSDSGIYFSRNGEFVVEDMPNGGDLDFNDGDYVQFSGGQGTAQTLKERSNITYETQVIESPLDPTLRQEVIEETEVVENLVQFDTVAEIERDWGQIELPETVATRLGHARAARTNSDEWLVYDRYSGASQVRLGSDGAGIAGQLAPLLENPQVPPTLLTGNVRFDPTVADNEAGLTATVGVTQFLSRTHRVARDIFGNEVAAANAESVTLLEPTGLFANRRMVGYVPPTPSETVMGTQLTSVEGIFEIPADLSVMIAAPDMQQVGRGNAAYAGNVGGLLLEDTAGNVEFLPQWSASGYAQEPTSLAPGAIQRIIYALVPQQPDQALQLAQRYPVTRSAEGYRIEEGNFSIISADQQPQNFVQEKVEVYAVEDTRPGANAVTALFNGVQGVYVEEQGGDRIATVDVTLPTEADARVGNALFPITLTTPEPGQRAYAKTTVAAGFYLGGALTTGIGNQRDTLTLMTSTMEQATDEVRTQTITHNFATPRAQLESLFIETTQTTVESGTAAFDINGQGELTNVNFLNGEIQSNTFNSKVLERTSRLRLGEELLLSSVSEETTQLMPSSLTLIEQDISTQRESYPNFAPLQGEIALGGVLNFGNTPWSGAANTLRAELFARDTVVGQGSDSETGWRAELVFHPFGEQQREAFQYDEAGNVVPVYRTEPLLAANGQQIVETLTDNDGTAVTLLANQFVRDEAGDRIAQTSGTGQPNGPGLYFRVEDVFSGDSSVLFAGGVQFSF